MTPKRKGRPLLVAATGLAFISFVDCRKEQPVGNLRGPEPIPDASMIPPVGNLRAPEPVVEDASIADSGTVTDSGAVKDSGASDAGAHVGKDAGPKLTPKPPIHPVGNLRAPR